MFNRVGHIIPIAKAYRHLGSILWHVLRIEVLCVQSKSALLKGGTEAFSVKAGTFEEARAKAAQIKSQGFHVEIIATDGSPMPFDE